MSPHFLILYVADVAKSAEFYETVLGRPALEASPGFAMFAVRDGLMLGLWASHAIKPQATPPGGMEFAITVGSKADVDARHSDWASRGFSIIQAPVDLDFGYTFVATDLDGHRIRVFVPGDAA